jgi:hypothetical protein
MHALLDGHKCRHTHLQPSRALSSSGEFGSCCGILKLSDLEFLNSLGNNFSEEAVLKEVYFERTIVRDIYVANVKASELFLTICHERKSNLPVSETIPEEILRIQMDDTALFYYMSAEAGGETLARESDQNIQAKHESLHGDIYRSVTDVTCAAYTLYDARKNVTYPDRPYIFHSSPELGQAVVFWKRKEHELTRIERLSELARKYETTPGYLLEVNQLTQHSFVRSMDGKMERPEAEIREDKGKTKPFVETKEVAYEQVGNLGYDIAWSEPRKGSRDLDSASSLLVKNTSRWNCKCDIADLQSFCDKGLDRLAIPAGRRHHHLSEMRNQPFFVSAKIYDQDKKSEDVPKTEAERAAARSNSSDHKLPTARLKLEPYSRLSLARCRTRRSDAVSTDVHIKTGEVHVLRPSDFPSSLATFLQNLIELTQPEWLQFFDEGSEFTLDLAVSSATMWLVWAMKGTYVTFSGDSSSKVAGFLTLHTGPLTYFFKSEPSSDHERETLTKLTMSDWACALHRYGNETQKHEMTLAMDAARKPFLHVDARGVSPQSACATFKTKLLIRVAEKRGECNLGISTSSEADSLTLQMSASHVVLLAKLLQSIPVQLEERNKGLAWLQHKGRLSLHMELPAVKILLVDNELGSNLPLFSGEFFKNSLTLHAHSTLFITEALRGKPNLIA